jgi:hypothetical protein
MTHAHHAALTLLSCGLWLPIWVLCALAGAIAPEPPRPSTHCTICGAPFRKVAREFTIDGKIEFACVSCANELQRRASKQAVQRRLDKRRRDDDEE